MVRDAVYKMLDRPIVYKAAQLILGPGAESAITDHINALRKTLPADNGNILDIGCGPESWLSKADRSLKPVGVDLTPSYIKSYNETGCLGVVGSADQIPFGENKFDSVWTIGLLHHLPDSVVHQTLLESVRVCKPGGHVVILDAVKPKHAALRPIASILRKMDRGEFMRMEAHIRSLFPNTNDWKVERMTYAYTGLEMLSCVYTKQ